MKGTFKIFSPQMGSIFFLMFTLSTMTAGVTSIDSFSTHDTFHPPSPQLYDPPNCKEWNADNRLECWLWQLRVEIPDESFSADFVTISIQNMVCSHFSLQDIQPVYGTRHSLDLSARKIVATCTGKYHLSGGISGQVQASVGVEEKSKVEALQLSFRLLPSTTYKLPRPFTFETTECVSHLKTTRIKFSGSISAKLIQTLSKPIGHYVTQALQEQVCPLLPKQLDPLVTEYLHQLDEWMKPYLSKQYELGVSHEHSSTPTGMDDHATELSRILLLDTNAPHRIRSRQQQQQDFERGILSQSSSSNVTMNILDWKSVHWMLRSINEQLDDHLQSAFLFPPNATQKYCPEQCQDLLRGFSGMFRSIVGPALVMPLPAYFHNITLPEVLPMDSTISVDVQRLSIQGLDQLHTLQLLRPDNGTLSSQVATDNGLEIQVPIVLHIQMPEAQHSLDEPFILKINVTKLETILETATGILDWDELSLLQVANAVQRFVENPTKDNIQPALGCLIRTIAMVDNKDWWTTILLESISISRQRSFGDQISMVDGSSSLEEDLDEVINTVLKLLLGEYSGLWTALIEGLIQEPAKHSLNEFLITWLHQYATDDACPAAILPPQPKYVNFTKFVVLNQMNDFLNHKSTIHTMNQFLKCSGKFLEGYVAARASDALQASPTLGALLDVTGVETRHWNGVQMVKLLQPHGDTTLESSIQWGTNETVPELQVNLQVSTRELSGFVNLTLFAGFQGQIGTQLDYDLNLLQNLTVAHFLQQVQCAMVPTATLQVLPNLTGATLGEVVGLNVSALLNNHNVFFSTLESGQAANDETSIADKAAIAIKWSITWIRDVVNQALSDWTLRSADSCPGVISDSNLPPSVNPDDTDPTKWYNYPFVWITITAIVLAQSAVFNVMVLPRQEAEDDASRNPLMTPLQLDPDDTLLDPSPLENDIDEYSRTIQELDRVLVDDIRNERFTNTVDQAPVNPDDDPVFTGETFESSDFAKPLLMTPRVPEWARFAIPIFIVGNVVLLISSNLSVGASVNLSLRIGDESIPIPGLFQFSLGNTITELFGAGIYPLLFLVVVFSGIWPYAKLIWMLHIWNAPYSNQEQRERRLLTLDALSKFSLVDTYVLVIMLVAFRFHLELSESLGLDVFVTPEFGFYAFLMATCLSLLIGHAMLYFHRSAESLTVNEAIANSMTTASIISHATILNADGSRHRQPIIVQVGTVTCCLVALAGLLLGMGQDSFSFDVGGLAGMALGDRHLTKYSLLSLGWEISDSVENPGSFAVICLQIAYYFYAVVTPVACLLLLLLLLLVPVTIQVQKNLIVAAEIANAWSAVEVFVLSIVAALFQLSTFASFIIGDRCDQIHAVAAILIDQDILPADDASCFSVTAIVDYYGSAKYLIVGVLLNSLAAGWVLRLAHACIQQRKSEHLNGGGATRDDIEEDEEEEASPEWRFWF